jgi:L-rhamnose mutarotase
MQYVNETLPVKTYKRFCKVLELKNDPELIEAYKAWHAPGGVWPEIIAGLHEVGVIDMEIYLHGTLLIMIMDTEASFDHHRDMGQLAGLPRQAEWEALMGRFQDENSFVSPTEKWRSIERVFKLDA